MTCEEAETALVLGGSPGATIHRSGCLRCAAGAGQAIALGQRLQAYPVADPRPGSLERILAAAAPLLAENAARVREPRRRLVWALTAMAALLPLVVAANAQVVRTAHSLLSGFLPVYLTSYLVGSLALFLALLLALACASVPLLAARQRLRLPEEIHV